MLNHLPASPPPSSPEDITVVKIFESLRDRIVGGAIAPGSLINSVELARDFGTSRTPVREALLILNQHGLVSLSARRRPRVAEVTQQAIRELYAVRSALHDHIAEAIVLNAGNEQIDALYADAQQLLQDIETQSMAEHLLSVERYLSAEARLAENALLLELLDSMKWRIAWFRRLGGLSLELLKAAAQDRVRVAQAYSERDLRLAQAMNRSMLRKAGTACEEGFMRLTSQGQALA